jgi:small-conductance mechanosensitive channel
MTRVFSEPWFLWALAITVGFPLGAVVLGEIADRLRRAGQPLAAVATGLRNGILPIAMLYLLLTEVLGVAEANISARVVVTGLWIGLLYVSLTTLNIFVFERADTGTWRSRAPKLFLDLVRLLMVFVGGALILSLIWQRNLGGLLAALGVGSIVLGLALQDTLGSLVSGIGLLFERPFAIGDWIKVADHQGEVIEINWRSVRLRTRADDLLVMPNSILAKEPITNIDRPSAVHAEFLEVAFPLHGPPNRVKRLLFDVAISVPSVLRDPAPVIELVEFDDDRLRYEAKVYTESRREIRRIRSDFATRVWYAAQREGIAFPVPERSIRQVEAPQVDTRERALGCLRRVAVFAVLEPPELETLARNASLLHFAAGETVLRQGDAGRALCIVVQGAARLIVSAEDGATRDAAPLGERDLFGEAVLQAGETSSATVTASEDLEVLALDTVDLESVLERNAKLAGELGHLVELRRRALQRLKRGLYPLESVATNA